LRVESAELSLIGGRENNEDRVGVAVAADAALLVVCDGMGGHSDGETAAEQARLVILERFWQTPQPLLDPLGFLHLAIGAAHKRVVELGVDQPLERRPRATCAVCLVQHSSAYWIHVGDSRIYHLRAGRVRERTRDHSHVELLVREGLISDGQVQNHPMRNYVESCIGGDIILPEMAVSPRRALLPGDVLLGCTDGFWGSLDETEAAVAFGAATRPADEGLLQTLKTLSERAVSNGGFNSDNTSVAALQFLA
jgi:serine/threonine protein phosphatase PrpC